MQSMMILITLICGANPVFAAKADDLQHVDRLVVTLAKGALCEDPAITAVAVSLQKEGEVKALFIWVPSSEGRGASRTWSRCHLVEERSPPELACRPFPIIPPPQPRTNLPGLQRDAGTP
jgi:hypothetical protein